MSKTLESKKEELRIVVQDLVRFNDVLNSDLGLEIQSMLEQLTKEAPKGWRGPVRAKMYASRQLRKFFTEEELGAWYDSRAMIDTLSYQESHLKYQITFMESVINDPQKHLDEQYQFIAGNHTPKTTLHLFFPVCDLIAFLLELIVEQKNKND